jgi:hypothetical protein
MIKFYLEVGQALEKLKQTKGVFERDLLIKELHLLGGH